MDTNNIIIFNNQSFNIGFSIYFCFLEYILSLFVYKYLLNHMQKVQHQRHVSKFLKDYDPKDVLVVSARQYGWKPATKFAKSCGFECIAGRFTPGRLTNPEMRFFIEPKIIVLTDPAADAQAFREATNINIPVIAMCDSNNLTTNVDLVIPGNNKGRRSLALIYWLLSRELLRIRGELAKDEDLEETIDDFEAPLI